MSLNRKETTFGSFYRDKRETKKITLKTVAEKLGWSIVYVSEIELGRRPPPTPDKIKIMAEAIGESFDELFSLANLFRKSIELPIDSISSNKANLAIELARSWSELPDDFSDEDFDRFAKTLKNSKGKRQ